MPFVRRSGPMISVTLPAVTGMKLGSTRRTRPVEAGLVEGCAARTPHQLVANNASRTTVRFIKVQYLFQRTPTAPPPALPWDCRRDGGAVAGSGFDAKSAA